jgi:branched-chain amino acid transport system ATP-binding protein
MVSFVQASVNMSASLLKVRGLSKSFGGLRAVDSLDLDIAVGERVALIGPNGAGKSTTFNMLNGQLKPDAGRIQLNQQIINGQASEQMWALGVGRTFQIALTFQSFTVLQNVQIALLSHQKKYFNFLSSNIKNTIDPSIYLLGLVGLSDQANRPCSELAYGDVKRLELALAISNRPRLLLMDEPTAGMAPSERKAMMQLTSRLVEEQKMGLLFTEHSMDVVFHYADRIVVMDQGRCIANGTPNDVKNNSLVQSIYLGASAQHITL